MVSNEYGVICALLHVHTLNAPLCINAKVNDGSINIFATFIIPSFPLHFPIACHFFLFTFFHSPFSRHFCKHVVSFWIAFSIMFALDVFNFTIKTHFPQYKSIEFEWVLISTTQTHTHELKVPVFICANAKTKYFYKFNSVPFENGVYICYAASNNSISYQFLWKGSSIVLMEN